MIAFNLYIIACKVDMINAIPTVDFTYHHDSMFKFWFISKPLVRVVFSNFCKLRERCFFPFADCLKNVE